MNYSDPTGHYYLSKYQLKNFIRLYVVCGVWFPTPTAVITFGVYKLYSMLIVKAALFGAKVGAWLGTFIGQTWVGALGAIFS